MKKPLLLSFLLLISYSSRAQDCTIDPFIKEHNHYDAEVMGLKEMKADTSGQYKDSILVPRSLVNKYLLILSSAYRLDPVPFKSDVHVNTYDDMYTVYIEVDKTVPWIQNFANGRAKKTGNAYFDALLDKYKLARKTIDMFEPGNGPKAGKYWIRLESDYYLNPPALLKCFDKIKGVRKAAYEEIPTVSMRTMEYDLIKNVLSLFVQQSGDVFKDDEFYFKVISPCQVERQ